MCVMLMQAEPQERTNGQGKWRCADCREGTRRCHLVGRVRVDRQALRRPSLVTSSRVLLISDLFLELLVDMGHTKVKSPVPSSGL